MADITPRMSAADYLQMMGVKPISNKQSAQSDPSKIIVSNNKYRAKRTKIGDETFDSAKESRTYQMLVMSMTARDPFYRAVILVRSKRYLLIPKKDDERASYYVCDFYVEYADGHVDVIDTKSAITRKNPLYVLKRKLMLERYDIKIKEM